MRDKCQALHEDSRLLHSRRVTNRDEENVASTSLHVEVIDVSVMAQTHTNGHSCDLWCHRQEVLDGSEKQR